MVVISIITILLLFSFPVFKNFTFFSDTTSHVSDIVRLINDLKKRAVELNTDFLMHIDPGAGMVWVTDEIMTDDAKAAAKETAVFFSDRLVVLDIEFPDIKQKETREYQIRFRKQGYSDFALIHMMEGGTIITVKIEPFLSQAQVLDKQVHFDDCI